MRIGASAGVLMLIAAVAAIWWANSPYYPTYHKLLETNLWFGFGEWELHLTLKHLINDGLMTLFFFVVGLEIKRELVLGELRDRKLAALPVFAALGGMILPALIYLAFAGADPAAARGWGVPMATDIAFSVGVLSMLGRRVPTGAKLFLLALAIADDLGGILVIATFYTSTLSAPWLGAGILALAGLAAGSRMGIRSYAFYIPAAVGVWVCFMESGVHATVAGVAIAFLTPARPMYGAKEFDVKGREILDTFPAEDGTAEQRERADHEALLLAEIARESAAPLVRAEHRLTALTSFVVVPIFALANAGVHFGETSLVQSLGSDVALGVAFGLVFGKTLGITLFAWLAVKLGLARLPRFTTWRHMVGVAATAGIGFTVALFITALAYTDPVLADSAKVGIFAGSLVAGLLGVALLRSGKPLTNHE